MKQILPPTLLLICLVGMLLLHIFLPVAVIFTMPLNLAGILPLGLGLALAMAGSNLFEKVGTNIMTFDEPGKLVVNGLYQYSRNPMYLGFALVLAGVWILLGTLSPLVLVLSFVVITDRWYIAYEERRLTAKFGGLFEAYKTKTRRWI